MTSRGKRRRATEEGDVFVRVFPVGRLPTAPKGEKIPFPQKNFCKYDPHPRTGWDPSELLVEPDQYLSARGSHVNLQWVKIQQLLIFLREKLVNLHKMQQTSHHLQHLLKLNLLKIDMRRSRKSKHQPVALIMWSEIPDSVNRYGNIRPTNKMSFDELALLRVHINQGFPNIKNQARFLILGASRLHVYLERPATLSSKVS